MTGILALLLTGSLLFSLLYFPRLLKTDLWHSVSPPPSFAPRPKTHSSHFQTTAAPSTPRLNIYSTTAETTVFFFFVPPLISFSVNLGRVYTWAFVPGRFHMKTLVFITQINPPSVRNSPFKEVNIQPNEMCNRALKLTLTNVNKITLKKKDEKGQKNKYKLRQKTL